MAGPTSSAQILGLCALFVSLTLTLQGCGGGCSQDELDKGQSCAQAAAEKANGAIQIGSYSAACPAWAEMGNCVSGCCSTEMTNGKTVKEQYDEQFTAEMTSQAKILCPDFTVPCA